MSRDPRRDPRKDPKLSTKGVLSLQLSHVVSSSKQFSHGVNEASPTINPAAECAPVTPIDEHIPSTLGRDDAPQTREAVISANVRTLPNEHAVVASMMKNSLITDLLVSLINTQYKKSYPNGKPKLNKRLRKIEPNLPGRRKLRVGTDPDKFVAVGTVKRDRRSVTELQEDIRKEKRREEERRHGLPT